MNLLVHIRRLRWLPQMLLAIVLLAVAQTSIMPCAMANDTAPMSEHCIYCPAADTTGSDCAFPHAPTVDVFASATHHAAVLFDSPLLQSAPFNLSDLREMQVAWPTIDFIPAPQRPLNLTHCVQLK